MFFECGRANWSCRTKLRLPARLLEPATRNSVKLGIGYAVARHRLAHQAYDDHTQTARMPRIGARIDATEVARRANAVGATTDSNARAWRRQRDGCATRPRRNRQESQETEEERGPSMAYLR